MNAALFLAWLLFSFLFWRGLRTYAVDEDRIFDLTFYATFIALFFGRVGFFLTNWDAFVGKSWLLIFALWVLPGFSWLAGLVGGTATLVLLSRRYKVRLGLVLDTLATALPIPIIIGEIGSLVRGVETGKALPFTVKIGSMNLNTHPVALYEVMTVLIIFIVVFRLLRLSLQKKWPYGIVGVWFFLLYAVSQFMLEFTKDTHVYWGNLSANQWVLIGIFAECIGVLYIRGGGREALRPVTIRLSYKLSRIRKGINEFISRRNTRGT